MILRYINAAMERAHYEIIDDAEPFYGSIPGLQKRARALLPLERIPGADND